MPKPLCFLFGLVIGLLAAAIFLREPPKPAQIIENPDTRKALSDCWKSAAEMQRRLGLERGP